MPPRSRLKADSTEEMSRASVVSGFSRTCLIRRRLENALRICLRPRKRFGRCRPLDRVQHELAIRLVGPRRGAMAHLDVGDRAVLRALHPGRKVAVLPIGAEIPI